MFPKTTMLHTTIRGLHGIPQTENFEEVNVQINRRAVNTVANYQWFAIIVKKSPESLTPQRNVIMTYRRR